MYLPVIDFVTENHKTLQLSPQLRLVYEVQWTWVGSIVARAGVASSAASSQPDEHTAKLHGAGTAAT